MGKEFYRIFLAFAGVGLSVVYAAYMVACAAVLFYLGIFLNLLGIEIEEYPDQAQDG